MRESVSLGDLLTTIASSIDILSTSLDNDLHNGVSLVQQSPMHLFGDDSSSPSGNEPAPSYFLASSLGADITSEDEAGMSSDGGVQLNMSTFHAEDLNDEMDMVDADVMGPYNLAAIATDHTFVGSSDLDDDMEDQEDTTQSSIQDNTPQVEALTSTEHGNAQPHLSADLSNLPNAISEFSQQLQNLQDGQEQGDFEISNAAHGYVIDHHSNDPIPSNPSASAASFFPILADQGNTISFNGAHSESVSTSLHHSHGALQNVDVGSFYESVDGDIDTSDITDANDNELEDPNNYSLEGFLVEWVRTAKDNKKTSRVPRLGYIRETRHTKPNEINFADLRGDRCDFQGINWKKLEVKRSDARKMRMDTYKNYHNLNFPNHHPLTVSRSAIPDFEDFFKFRRMNFKPEIKLAHFQLRNLLACTSRNNVFYAGESRVHQINPVYGQRITRMNLSEPEIHSAHAGAWNGVQISTIAAGHNLLIAGGFHGEYGMISLDRPNVKHTEGIIVDHLNSITNHMQIQLSRSSGLPQAAIASNDCGVRLLDCTTNGFIAHHEYDQAINCTALSPDHRLRVLVGDTKNVMICNAETGEIVQELNGHVDYGFACAWADNGWHVATGNQDMLIKIWDARMWTDSNGDGKALSTISATKAGVRCLKFSPLGSGKRVLLAAEPADFLSIIDAESYASKQRLDFYGEIAGTDFSPDGQNIYVGIHDSWRGGIMEFEKCGFGNLYKQDMKPTTGEELYNTEAHHKRMAAGLDWKRTIDEVVQDPRSMRTTTHHRRQAANLGDLDLW